MAGGLMQLVAYGAQDIFLTGNPQITYFKAAYRRHTNFAIEPIEQVFNGNPTFGQKVSATVSRNGDLINQVYLQAQFPALSVASVWASNGPTNVAWTNSLMHALVQYVDIEIGGSRIDRHYGMWLEIWDELTQTAEKQNGYNHMVGKYNASVGLLGNASNPRIYYLPLAFWFCRNIGLSLPLIALQYHEVKITIQFNPAQALIVGLNANGDRSSSTNTTNIADVGGVQLTSTSLWIDYVFLDNFERRQFAQMAHEYLIDQLQQSSEPVTFTSPGVKYRMNFNHPVMELVWVLQRQINTTIGTAYNDWFNFSAAGPGIPDPTAAVDLMAAGKILLNNHDRIPTRPQTYFRLVVPWKCHTRVPNKHIYVYSFAIAPEEHQPSGTCNFSRIDNAQLVVDLTPSTAYPASAGFSGWGSLTGGYEGTTTIFATNKNVLRIMSGMGGLAYSN
jgi:hypothetical protein